MKSVTKHILEKEALVHLVEENFPGEQIGKLVELEEGMFNSAYLLTGSGILKDGAVLKLGPKRETKVLTYEKDILKAEVEVLNILEKMPIPTPRVLAGGNYHGSDYFFMTCMEGELWKNVDRELIQQARPQLMRELGRYNAIIHALPGKWFGYLKDDKRYQYDTWYEAFYGMMNDILEDGRRDGHELPYNEIRRAIVKNRTALDLVKEPWLVDYDMWAGNVFVKLKEAGDNKGLLKVSGIIDFERCFYGDPYADFTSAFGLFDDVEKEPEFCEGYNEAAGHEIWIGEPERIRMDLYRLYMFVILFVETYRYEEEVAEGRRTNCRKVMKDLLRKLG